MQTNTQLNSGFNKKIILMICIFILIITFSLTGCSHASHEAKDTKSTIEMGSAMKEAAAELKNSGKSGISKVEFEYQNGQNTEYTNAAMSIMGYTIDKTYFKYRVSLYSACGSSQPITDATELMKQQTAEWDFAQRNGLLPSEKDITDYCNTIRKTADSDKENKEILSGLIKSMGLTEDEYFNIIQYKYEAPFILISENIGIYCKENNINPPDWQDVKAEIIDSDYINNLKKMY